MELNIGTIVVIVLAVMLFAKCGAGRAIHFLFDMFIKNSLIAILIAGAVFFLTRSLLLTVIAYLLVLGIKNIRSYIKAAKDIK